jgi:hypothetical protein
MTGGLYEAPTRATFWPYNERRRKGGPSLLPPDRVRRTGTRPETVGVRGDGYRARAWSGDSDGSHRCVLRRRSPASPPGQWLLRCGHRRGSRCVVVRRCSRARSQSRLGLGASAVALDEYPRRGVALRGAALRRVRRRGAIRSLEQCGVTRVSIRASTAAPASRRSVRTFCAVGLSTDRQI